MDESEMKRPKYTDGTLIAFTSGRDHIEELYMMMEYRVRFGRP